MTHALASCFKLIKSSELVVEMLFGWVSLIYFDFQFIFRNIRRAFLLISHFFCYRILPSA